MPADPDLLAQDWDFPPYQGARLVSGTLWRPSRFQHDAEPDTQPLNRQREPGSRIYSAGGTTISSDSGLRDREIVQHVRRTIAFALPADRHPGQDPSAIAAALEPADAVAMAYRIADRSSSGAAADRDAALIAFMSAVDNLDTTVETLASYVPALRSARPVMAQKGLEQTCTRQRDASSIQRLTSGNPAVARKSWPARALPGPAAPCMTRPGWPSQPRGRARRGLLPAERWYALPYRPPVHPERGDAARRTT
jgi:hypothetical protein